MSEKPSRQVNRQSRCVAKAEWRKADLSRLSQGEQAAVLQGQNSILSDEFFRKGRISNFARAVGR